MNVVTPRWTRILLVALGLPNLVTGLWAVIDPQGWFENFPGWAPRLVAAHPPFNDHLATDAGAGLLATGLLALFAAWQPRRHVIATAMLGYAAFTLPHTLFHVFERGQDISGTDRVAEVAPLVLATGAAIVILLDALTRPEATS